MLTSGEMMSPTSPDAAPPHNDFEDLPEVLVNLPKPPRIEGDNLPLVKPPLRRLKRANDMVRPIAHSIRGEDPV